MLTFLRGKLFFLGTAAFLIGIVCGTLYGISFQDLLVWVIIGALCCMAASLCAKNSNFHLIFLALGVSSILFCIGAVRAGIEQHTLPSVFQPLLNQPVSLLGTIVADPDLRAKNQQLVVEVSKENPLHNGVEHTRLLVFAPLFQHFSYGEEILLAGTLTLPTPFVTDTGRIFRYDTYLEQKHIFAVVPQANILEVQSPRGLVAHVADTLFNSKHMFVFGLSRALPTSLAELAEGILTGDQHHIPEDILSALELSGMLWIVVLSGYHITLMASSIQAATGFLPRQFQYLCIVVGISAIIFATGASAPSLRGACMAAFSLYARATHRTYDALRALCVVVVFLLFWNPLLLTYDFGFQLSIIVTPAILLGVPILEKGMLWINLHFVREIISVSVVAQLACLPLVLWETGSLELWAIPPNILTMWLVPFVMVSSFCAGLVGTFLSPLAPLAALPAYYVLSYLTYIAKSAASLPYAALSISEFSFVYVVLQYVLLVLVFSMLARLQTPEARKKLNALDPSLTRPHSRNAFL